MEDNKIIFTEEDGSKTTFYIIDETKINGTSYILVTDSDDDSEEEAEAYIMKDVSAADSEEAVYEFVDEPEEFDAVADIFGELADEDTELIK